MFKFLKIRTIKFIPTFITCKLIIAFVKNFIQRGIIKNVFAASLLYIKKFFPYQFIWWISIEFSNAKIKISPNERIPRLFWMRRKLLCATGILGGEFYLSCWVFLFQHPNILVYLKISLMRAVNVLFSGFLFAFIEIFLMKNKEILN